MTRACVPTPMLDNNLKNLTKLQMCKTRRTDKVTALFRRYYPVTKTITMIRILLLRN